MQETVQFIHESVRDFLIKDNGLYKMWPHLGADPEGLGHEKLKQCCYWYMNQQSVAVMVHSLSPDTVAGDPRELRMRYPFLDYSNKKVLYHADTASDAVSQELFLSGFPFGDWIVVRNLFEKNKIRRYTQNTSCLYLLAEKGLSKLIRMRLEKDPHAGFAGGRYGYPLLAALANGEKGAVAALLGLTSTLHNGMDITEGLIGMKCVKRYKNRTPFTWAAQEGQASIAKLLLQQGTPVEETDGDGATAISRASAAGQEAMVRLLIEKGADVNSTGYGLSSHPPIVEAALSGHEATVRLLIESGADVNSYRSRFETPLFYAAKNNLVDIVRLLIEKGADINGGGNLTPLFRASSMGSDGIARLLIENGADVSPCSNNIGMPLYVAFLSGHEHIARLLIEGGADVNARDKRGHTLLSIARSRGNDHVARLLIEHGAMQAEDNE